MAVENVAFIACKSSLYGFRNLHLRLRLILYRFPWDSLRELILGILVVTPFGGKRFLFKDRGKADVWLQGFTAQFNCRQDRVIWPGPAKCDPPLNTNGRPISSGWTSVCFLLQCTNVKYLRKLFHSVTHSWIQMLGQLFKQRVTLFVAKGVFLSDPSPIIGNACQ